MPFIQGQRATVNLPELKYRQLAAESPRPSYQPKQPLEPRAPPEMKVKLPPSPIATFTLRRDTFTAIYSSGWGSPWPSEAPAVEQPLLARYAFILLEVAVVETIRQGFVMGNCLARAEWPPMDVTADEVRRADDILADQSSRGEDVWARW